VAHSRTPTSLSLSLSAKFRFLHVLLEQTTVCQADLLCIIDSFLGRIHIKSLPLTQQKRADKEYCLTGV